MKKRSDEVKNDLEVASALEVVAKSKGGEIIAKSLRTDLFNSVERLANSYPTATHAELMALCATLRANLGLIRVFKNAPKNKKLLNEELDLALKEEGSFEETGS